MAVTDGQLLTAAARWPEDAHYLREFATRHRFPAIVKIVKGQYGGLGVPSLPSPCLNQIAILISAGVKRKLVAQSVKIKEGRKATGVGPKFVIPETYQGYFEILSEDGRATRCLESVAELAHRKLDGCLVRDSIRGVIGRYNSEGHLLADGGCVISPGEILYPETEVPLANCKNKFLRCLNNTGQVVLLEIDQKCRFSALAREDNISGVHTVKNLFQKRLPVTVRLVHGLPPRGLKSANFLPELRLLSAFEEEHILAVPLQKENAAVVLPLTATLKMQRARNEDGLKETRAYQRLYERCVKLSAELVDDAYTLENKLLPEAKCTRELRSASADARTDEYDEIDVIYDYVRGFAPLPKCKPFRRGPEPPEPPPIETIPNIKREKRIHKAVETDKSSAKLYVKNGNNPQRRLLRQKSASPLKEHAAREAGSPIGARYKSLNNLMAQGGTLESSNSGDKTSVDSAVCAKVPEKKSKRISRSRSLTNLVWDISELEPYYNRKIKSFKIEPAMHKRLHTQHSYDSQRRIGTLYL